MTKIITAGQLRQAGWPVPDGVPDEARTAIRFDEPTGIKQNDGTTRWMAPAKFVKPFEWETTT